MATTVATHEELQVETTAFWGGQKTGRMVELTVNGFSGSQVQMTRAQATEAVKQLVSWLGEGK